MSRTLKDTRDHQVDRYLARVLPGAWVRTLPACSPDQSIDDPTAYFHCLLPTAYCVLPTADCL